MGGIFRNSFDGDSNAPETEILGGTDQTKIGNTGDRLHVDASVPVIPNQTVLNFSAHLENSGNRDATVDGSVTPVDFSEGPSAGEIWYVYELTMTIMDLGTMDATDFGTESALPDPGLEFFAKINSTEHRITRVRDNIEIAQEFASQNFQTDGAAFLDDDDHFTGTQIWRVPTKLVGDNNDKIIMRINDDLTSIDQLQCRIAYYKAIS